MENAATLKAAAVNGTLVQAPQCQCLLKQIYNLDKVSEVAEQVFYCTESELHPSTISETGNFPTHIICPKSSCCKV